MKFVDRSKEIAALEREYHREEASLVIIYGRRRVGKTELIRHFIQDKTGLRFQKRVAPIVRIIQKMKARYNEPYHL